MKSDQTLGELRTKTLQQRSRGRCLIELTAPLTYRLKSEGLRVAVTVPRGFVTDAATIPMGLWPVFPPDGPWIRAAVIHDYLDRCDVPRWLCDAVVRHIMEVDRVAWWRRCLIFYAVRLFGRLFRKKDCP